MSWSIKFHGIPETVVQKLQTNSTEMQGHSKKEYDNALPHLIGLVEQNFGNGLRQVEISANGHGWDSNRVCSVTLQEHDPLI